MLLVAAGLLVGASAWAYTPTLTEKYEVAGYKVKAYYDISNTNVNNMCPTEGDLRFRGSGYGLFNFGSGDRGADITLSVSESDLLLAEFKDSQARSVTLNSISNCTKDENNSSGDIFAFNVTANATSLNVNVGRGGCIIAFLVLEKDASVATAEYTINYLLNGEGEPVKTVTGEGAVGSSVNTDVSFFVGDTKYFRADDAPASVNISADNNVFNINVRLAATYSYTVNAIDTESKILVELANGSGIEGEEIYVPFARIMNVDGTIYTSNTANGVSAKLAVTLDSDNKVATKTFNATDKTNVCFFTEAENIEGMTSVNAGGVDARCSYAAGGYSADYVEVTTLEAGVYTMTAAAYANNTTFSFKAGEEEVHTFTPTGSWTETTSAKFAIHEKTTLYAKGGNGDNHALDYVYVQRIGDVPVSIPAVIGTAGWATLYTDYALNFSNVDGLTAYTATCDGSTVELTPVQDVPAQTGVVLKGNASTYNIPLTSSSDTDRGSLRGSTTNALAYNANAANDYYMLALNDAKEVQFTKLTSGSIEAGKAYLELPKPASENAPARILNVVFAGETTGIAEVEKAGVENGAIYNLSGQRVNKPANGLYIMNGKKVIIK